MTLPLCFVLTSKPAHIMIVENSLSATAISYLPASVEADRMYLIWKTETL